MSQKRDIFYIFDKKLLNASRNIPNLGNRAIVVHTLISSYGLLSKCQICPGEEATDDDLMSFHSLDYLECLKKAQNSKDLEKLTNSEDIADFNLEYDCPLFENIYEFTKVIAGGSLTAAKMLTKHMIKDEEIVTIHKRLCLDTQSAKSYRKYLQKPSLIQSIKEDVFDMPGNLTLEEEDINKCLIENINEKSDSDKMENASDNVIPKKEEYVEQSLVMNDNESNNVKECPVAINWHGGWHHAQRDEAEGFCYINDIVIAIQYLLKSYKRVLYVDLDVHHGNGVENAFSFSPRVLTFSIHKYEAGFYPGSGSLKDVGQGAGKYYTVNAPLKEGIRDSNYISIFFKLAAVILSRYKPECVVIQCGSDSISGDPLGGFNITPLALGKCLKFILDQQLPTLVLGGGGYNIPNAARCWAYLTSIITNSTISEDIPENNFFHFFGPDFSLNVTPTLRRDENSQEYLQEVLHSILQNLKEIRTP